MSIADYIAMVTILISIVVFYWGQKPRPVIILWSVFGIAVSVFTTLIYYFADLSLEKALTTGTGYTALFALALVLNIGPLMRLTKNSFVKILFKNRRNIGVAMFILALMHYLSIWSIIFLWDQPRAQRIVESGSEFGQGVINGLVMMFITFVIAAISNKKSQKFLKKWWKRIQLLAYVVILMTIFHVTHVGVVIQRLPVVAALYWITIVFTILLKGYDVYAARQKKAQS
jgi:DMSO/TMAO reductase YedYZ heme-binding membrane subunit